MREAWNGWCHALRRARYSWVISEFSLHEPGLAFEGDYSFKTSVVFLGVLEAGKRAGDGHPGAQDCAGEQGRHRKHSWGHQEAQNHFGQKHCLLLTSPSERSRGPQTPTQNCPRQEAKWWPKGLSGHEGGSRGWAGQRAARSDETTLRFSHCDCLRIRAQTFRCSPGVQHISLQQQERRKLLSSCRDLSCPQKRKGSHVPFPGSASPVAAIAKETDWPS